MSIKTLLPAGCYDLLPPAARHEREIIGRLLGVFDRFGYEQVAPPLLEYTESLLAGRGSALATQTFRVMDPQAHKVMGLRADHTIQVARIAATRLGAAPRPLRLSYAGNILRMQPEKLRNERQLRQVGIELIGADSLEADAEVICIATQALMAVGIEGITVDLNLPSVVATLLSAEAIAGEDAQNLLQAVAHKDVATIRATQLGCADALAGLIETTGEGALARLRKLSLPADATSEMETIFALHDMLARALPAVTLTIDVTENHGLEYHSGVSFALYAKGASVELGRGGRYRVTDGSHESEATGFTLYVESLRELVPHTAPAPKVLVAAPLGDKAFYELAGQGYITLHAISGEPAEQQAVRLGCSYVWHDEKLKKL